MEVSERMSDPKTTAPRSHAPAQERTLLFPLAVASFVLGLLFLIGRASFSTGELLTESEVRRSWFLLGLGGWLVFQGVSLALLHLARSDDLAAGAPAALAARFRDGALITRLALLPRVLLAKRQTLLFLNVVVMVVLATALLLLVNYVFARHDLVRLDLTQQRLYSISEESAALVEALETDVRIVALLPSGGGEREQFYFKQVQQLVDQYRAHSPRVTLERLDPLMLAPDELERRRTELQLPDRSPSELTGLVIQAGLRQEDGSWRVEKSKHVTAEELFELEMRGDDEHGHGGVGRRVFRGEQQISTAIMEVTSAERVRVYFLAGHDEPSIGDFERDGLAELARALRDRNMVVERLALTEREEHDVPAECDVLVIPGPRVPLSERDLAAVKAYLDRGGDALVLLEPWPRGDDTGRTVWHPTGLEALLEQSYGVRVDDGWILFTGVVAGQGVGTAELELTEVDATHPVTKPLVDRARVWANTARPLIKIPVLGVETTALLETHPRLGSRIQLTREVMKQHLSARTETGPFTVALASERVIQPLGEAARAGAKPTRSRLIAVGDVDWVTNEELTPRTFTNLELLLNALNWCQEREKFLIGKAPRPPSYRLEMSATELERFKIAAGLGLPALALALGVVAWVLRYRS